MPTRIARVSVCAAIAVLWASAEGVAAAREPSREALERRRSERVAVPRPSALRRELPTRLLPDTAQSAGERSAVHRPQTDGPPEARDAEIRRFAAVEARRAADHDVRLEGVRDLFRIGFWQGLREALDDRWMGERDRREGLRDGRFDPGAATEGVALADEAASIAAFEDAARRVELQFRDLTSTPRFAPQPEFTPARWPLPDYPLPTLEQVWDDFPLREAPLIDPRWSGHLRGWSWQADRLRNCPSWEEFVDPLWRSPELAFARWSEDRQHSAIYRALADPDEKATFAIAFRNAYAVRLVELRAGPLQEAFEAGLDAGWTYGVFTRAEFEYRLGYREGWLDALEGVASAAYPQRYANAYDSAYRESYDDWSLRPKLEIARVDLLDGDEDGVFEPGEALDAEWEIVNFGGGAARESLRLVGELLVDGRTGPAELPARSVTRGRLSAAGRVDPGTPTRTRTRVELVAGDLRRGVVLVVSRPLQFVPGDWSVTRFDLDGAVELDVLLRNESLRGLPATIELQGGPGARSRDSQVLDLLHPGEQRRLSLRVEGMDPLELLAGAAVLELSVASDGREHDSRRFALPDAARDLRNPDLATYLGTVAADPAVDPQRIETLRGLVLTRLREDWRVAVAVSGNPYKADLRTRGRSTALGELVAIYRAQPPVSRRHAVFAGLSDEIDSLSATLPGVHPLLRKWMRRLGSELR